MTDKELIEELEKLGFKVFDRKQRKCYEVFKNESYVGMVSKEYLYKMDTSYGDIVGREEEVKKLYKILSKYVETPIEYRRPTKYYKYYLKNIIPGDNRGLETRCLNKNTSTGEFFLSNDIEEYGAKTIFSEYDQDIKKIDFSLFKRIQVK